ncbi:seryl-tRNA synthetase [Amylostereum chailletii]|nr:seryl-tRNA synthetase [Amylostereum chailletii]
MNTSLRNARSLLRHRTPLPSYRGYPHSPHKPNRHSPLGIAGRRYSSKSEQFTSSLPKPRPDYRGISENAVYKSHNAFNRRANLPTGAIQSIERLYGQWKDVSAALNAKRHAQSLVGARVREAAKDPSARNAVLAEAKTLKTDVSRLEDELHRIDEQLFNLAVAVPNDTHPATPLGPETNATTLSTHGPAPFPASPSRDHVSIAHTLDLLDLESAAIVTGSSWYYLKNEAALLEMALTNYALAVAIKHGFTPVTTPDVVRTDITSRCGFQPRDPAPRKVVGLGRAFRAEAGAGGADTRGLYRVHQFTKLEMFIVSTPEQSEEMMDTMKQIQIEIFESLRFPFRVLDMPTEELGASAYRKYDMEAWMPGRGGWGEISSTSNCTDYQARRLHIRYRPAASEAETPNHSGAIRFVHTLNGTAAAIPRLIIALLENGVRFDEAGEVVGLDLPNVLKPFWLGDSSRDVVCWK